MPQINYSVMKVPRTMSTAKLGKMLKETLTQRDSKRVYRSTFPSTCKSRLVAVRSSGKDSRLERS